MPATQRELLHRHGRPATWANLGLWPDGGATDYATACAALARCVGQAAGLAAGQRVLSLACGAGDELRLWRAEFGVAEAVGTDRDAAAAELSGERVLTSMPDGRFDAVLCVDAAYHLAPRSGFIAQAFGALQPGGALAFTDLVLEGRRAAWLRAAAWACGVPAADLVPAAVRAAQLREAGFAEVRHERLDDAVLGGFARFVAAQRRRLGREAAGPGWRRVAATAWLIPPARAAGIGYALFSARRPSVPSAAPGPPNPSSP